MLTYCNFMRLTLYWDSLAIMLLDIAFQLLNKETPSLDVIMCWSVGLLVASQYFEHRYKFFLEQDNRRHRGHLD